MRIWVNRVFILTSRKTEIARSAGGPKSQGPRAEDVLAESDLLQKILVIWLQQITKFSVKVVNLETTIDMQSWCKTWPPNGSSRIRANQKTSQETQRSLQKFLEPDRKPKVIYTDNSVEFGNACEDLSLNHCTSTPHRSETRGIAEEWKKGHLRYWTKNGRQIPWNAIPICETFKSSCLMGRLHMQDALENQLKRTNYPVWFIGWLSSYNCEGPVKNPSIWKESLTWIVPRIRFVRGVNLEGWHNGCGRWGVGNDGRIGNLLWKTQCKGSHISQR